MPPLNPFLCAFFSSKLPAQCKPPSQYILFFPSTEHLLTHKEAETGQEWAQLVEAEDVLASHVVSVPVGSGPLFNPKEGGSLRDGKGKARMYNTLNGRTVVVKDNLLITHKGFKQMHHARLLNDFLYYPDQLGADQWMVIYIDEPLVGTPLPLYSPAPPGEPQHAVNPDKPATPSKDTTEIKDFNDLLNNYPIIARHMQPGLEKLFQQFMVEVTEREHVESIPPTNAGSEQPDFERPLVRRAAGSFSSTRTSEGAASLKSNLASAGPVETNMRSALESLIFGAIGLFQNADKHQLSILVQARNLSNATLDRMIERYVTEHFHTRVLFPRIRTSRLTEDDQLEAATKHMSDLDMSQVGASLDGGQAERKELNKRLQKGVQAFKRMADATSPQEMVDALLSSARAITTPTTEATSNAAEDPEKQSTVILTNADLLVSMLLIVVVRSPIKHLHARLAYMVGFIFTEEVETGEVGYALSTFEAVLSYLSTHASGLKRASQANRALRKEIRKGNLSGVRRVLEPDNDQLGDTAMEDSSALPELQESVHKWMNGNGSAANGNGHARHESTKTADAANGSPTDGSQKPEANSHGPKLKKKVSLSEDVRSRSSSSAQSVASTTPSALSRTSTMKSTMSYNVKDETSPERLSYGQDANGNSLLMLAVEAYAPRILDYLLDRSDLFPFIAVLEDCDNDGTTLLSAAMKTGHQTVIDILVEFIATQTTNDEMTKYMARQDSSGRSASHYLFNAPHLMSRLAPALTWDLRDKNGQTPLFALCRSYDHDDYLNMVEMALDAARKKQGDGEPLHLDRHADSKMNTLLHIANDHRLVRTLLRECDVDPNIKNEKQFTPLMVASKFARLDSVRLLFHDTRTDLLIREARGFTAVELAKDDDIRNRIDDLLLLVHSPGTEGRVTMIVRSYFVEDGTIRMILKSGASNSRDTIMVTTCRRSLTDFIALCGWLSQEHPGSWIPALTNFRSPFQLPFRPSRMVLRDIQLRLDAFLRTMLLHPTFARHEMLWEFFLVPDVDPEHLSQRARDKARLRKDNLRIDYSPIPLDAASSIELFTDHATDQVRAVHLATQEVFNNVNKLRYASCDLADAQSLVMSRLSALTYVPADYMTAMRRFTHAIANMNFAAESSPFTSLHYQLLTTLSTSSALLTALSRPAQLITQMRTAAEAQARHEAASTRNTRWPSPLGLLDDARRRLIDDSTARASRANADLLHLGRELAYTQATVASELAGWWELRGGVSAAGKPAPPSASETASTPPLDAHEARLRASGTVRAGLREFASGMVIREKERLERLRRAGRLVGVDVFRPRRRGPHDSISLGTGRPVPIPGDGPAGPPTPAAPGTEPGAGNVDEVSDDGGAEEEVEEAALDAIREAEDAARDADQGMPLDDEGELGGEPGEEVEIDGDGGSEREGGGDGDVEMPDLDAGSVDVDAEGTEEEDAHE